jgi:hypothetical protein
MNRIKVIKRGGTEHSAAAPRHTESELRRRANEVRRRRANVVTDWIAEWREKKRKSRRRGSCRIPSARACSVNVITAKGHEPG